MLAVLNENIDAHEKQWINFYGWSLGQRLQNRNKEVKKHFKELNYPKSGGQSSLNQDVINTISDDGGIYFPDTRIYTEKTGGDDFEGNASAGRTYNLVMNGLR